MRSDLIVLRELLPSQEVRKNFVAKLQKIGIEPIVIKEFNKKSLLKQKNWAITKTQAKKALEKLQIDKTSFRGCYADIYLNALETALQGE